MRNFHELLEGKKPLVVTHDAGAANQLSDALREYDIDFDLIASGPAEQIFSWVSSKIRSPSSYRTLIKDCDLVITGTGWSTKSELCAMLISKKYNKRVISLIDHWVNYKERFTHKDKFIKPLELIVVDKWAEELARREFPSAIVHRIESPYLKNQIYEIQNHKESNDLLYIMEPIRGKWPRTKDPELEVFQYMLDNLTKKTAISPSNITIRPHPSDKQGKYDVYLKKFSNLTIRIDTHSPLNKAIGTSKIIAGYESYALAVAIQSGKTVISCAPPWAPPISLPQKDIIELRKLK